MKKTYAEKLLDPRWQKKRLECLQKDNFTCQFCGDKDKTLHVHHFCYPESGNPWESELSELMTVCCDCHSVSHLKGLTPLEKKLIGIIQNTGMMCSSTYPLVSYMVKEMNEILLTA
jgi:5-methylcytosine-specific restriction endonuclease McrA